MLAYLPLPQLRIVFRAGLYALLGIGAFALHSFGGPQLFWWVGLFLFYMSLQRLIVNVADQIADSGYDWFTTKTPQFMAWHTQVTELCEQHKLPPPDDALHLYTKGVMPEHALVTVAKRAKLKASF